MLHHRAQRRGRIEAAEAEPEGAGCVVRDQALHCVRYTRGRVHGSEIVRLFFREVARVLSLERRGTQPISLLTTQRETNENPSTILAASHPPEETLFMRWLTFAVLFLCALSVTSQGVNK